MGQNFSLLEYGNCRVLTHALMPMQCFNRVKVNFKGKILFFPLRNVCFFCISQEYDNVTTLNYPFFAQSTVCQVVAYERLKKKNFKLLALKVVAVAY